MDYAHRRRLKLYGHARIVTAEQDPELVDTVTEHGYDAVVERAVVVTVEAFDWNCPQHITPRFSATELEPVFDDFRQRLAALQDENTALKAALAKVETPATIPNPPSGSRIMTPQ